MHRGVGPVVAPGEAGHDLAEVERAGAVLRGHHIQPDHRRQHDQPAEQVVQQELHRGARPSGALTEAADEEIHRDEHGLEEHVEQQHVQRDHRDQHHRLDRQRQGDVGVHAPGVALTAVVPAGHQQQRDQHRGQQHQHQRDAVHAEGVAGAERRYPAVAFDELVGPGPGGRTVESDGDDDRDRQRQPADEQAGPFGELPQRRGQQDDQDGTGQRHQPQDAQPGDVGHHSCTASRSAITRAAPASIDNA